MKWSEKKDLRLQLQKIWDKGAILSSILDEENVFPLRLTLQVPATKEIAEHYTQVRSWIETLMNIKYIRLEMRSIAHATLGKNQIPHRAWIDSIEDAVLLLDKEDEYQKFLSIVNRSREFPQIKSYLINHPLKALAHAEQWDRILSVVAWIKDHPRCGLYLRQVDIPNVHSKFIERHRAIIMELLDLLLPEDSYNHNAKGIHQFCERYGFLDKPTRIRFRVLDASHSLLSVNPQADITLDLTSFINLNIDIQRIFITENEINFLTFPFVKDSMVIFGAGYGFAELAKALWMQQCEIFYWGDIDTHGFGILDQLRHHFPEARSLLMDHSTLYKHKSMWGIEEKQLKRDLPLLTLEERELYDDLRFNRIQDNLRLEQERISYGHLLAVIFEGSFTSV